jgi:hypothetical protein
MEAWYTTREAVRAALDVPESRRDNALIDSAIGAASRTAEGKLHRRFYPWTGTRSIDWPNSSSRSAYRLWLDANEMARIDSIVSGGVTLTADQYVGRTSGDSPEAPYDSIEILLSGNGAWSAGSTFQQAAALTGVFMGCQLNEDSLGTLSAPLAGVVTATASVTFTTADFGVGDMLRIDSERMIIVDRTMMSTGQTLQSALDDELNAKTLAVTDGTAFALDEILLIGAERMQIVDIAGNNLIVDRAVEGTTLAAYAGGTTIYGLTGVRLARAQMGTSVAAHSTSAEVWRHRPPSLVQELTMAYAITDLLQKRSGWARTVGSGESEREASGRGLSQILADARGRYGRKARHLAV